MEGKPPDGASPFDEEQSGHLPCPDWMAGDDEVVAVNAGEGPEPELDSPLHMHDLWVVLGLGEE